jgi:hypothetical protein
MIPKQQIGGNSLILEGGAINYKTSSTRRWSISLDLNKSLSKMKGRSLLKVKNATL